MRLLRDAPNGNIGLKILDFGLAKEIGQEQGKLTSTGAIMGTPLYLSPEQANPGMSQVDGRADQYAAGIVFYELLTGHVPFSGDNVAKVLLGHLTQPPPPLPRTVPEPLQKLVLRMLKKLPAERFPDDATLLKALAGCEAACAGAIAAPRTESLPLARGVGFSTTFAAQSPRTLLAASALALIAGVGVALGLVSRRGPPPLSPDRGAVVSNPGPLVNTVPSPVATPDLRAPAAIPPAVPSPAIAATPPETPPVAPIGRRGSGKGKGGATKKHGEAKEISAAPTGTPPTKEDAFAVPAVH